MKIEVRVKPGAKREQVNDLGGGRYEIAIRQRPVEGMANDGVREALADHFGIAKSRVVILRGLRSRIKMIEILETR